MDVAALRQRIARIAPVERCPAALASTGHEGMDAALGGGLLRGRLHEIFAGENDDASSAAGFAAMLALRLAQPGQALLWLRTDKAQRQGGCFHAPGWAELGGDPDTVVLALAPDDVALLRCAADAARCSGLGAIVAECWGKPRVLDLTASRRLALAAEQSGVPLLLLRVDAEPAPSAADTRWRVAAAPSQALAANAPGHSALDIKLLRRRSGPSGLGWQLEWNRDDLAFREPALSGALVPLSPGRTVADMQPRRRTG